MGEMALAAIICTFLFTTYSCQMKRDVYRHEIELLDCTKLAVKEGDL